MACRVLFVDDDNALRVSTVQWLQLSGFDVAAAENAAAAFHIAANDPPDVVISDVRMPKRSMAGLSARSSVSRPTPSGVAKAMRMKNWPVSLSQNWLDSAMLAPSAASSVVTAATMPGLSVQLRVRTKSAGIGGRLQKNKCKTGRAPAPI